jgi:hypothetical protein
VRTSLCSLCSSRRRDGARGLLGLSAFSLIEILVTVGLLSFIILGLLMMFNQTQRAFRSSITQTDVLESGRAIMDMLARELEQAVPSEYPDVFFNGRRQRTTNFFLEPGPGFNTAPLLQGLPGGFNPLTGGVMNRTNILQRFFFLNRINQDLIGVGYQVIPEDANGCIGSLYRFAGTNQRSAPVTVSSSFLSAAQLATNDLFLGRPVTNMNRIVDGVVHLRLRAFATNGSLIISFPLTNGFALTSNPRGPYTNVADTIVLASGLDPLQSACYFMKEAVPASIELEMGILEPQLLQRYRSIPLASAQRNFLSNHAAEVHIFRQRVPIQNIDFSAYP